VNEPLALHQRRCVLTGTVHASRWPMSLPSSLGDSSGCQHRWDGGRQVHCLISWWQLLLCVLLLQSLLRVCLSLSVESINHSTMFFYHNKLANSTFNHSLPPRWTGLAWHSMEGYGRGSDNEDQHNLMQPSYDCALCMWSASRNLGAPVCGFCALEENSAEQGSAYAAPTK
jgi:hypothetical protein